ncbi:MAG: sorting protein, partial [Pedosphaera sp.]|nr:sorting protein [Pedosphaera sp.]
MKCYAFFRLLGLAMLTVLVPRQGSAGNFSFTGHFTQDDNVQWFTFTITNPMPANARATVRTWSYAGGTNAAGQIIPAGGFVPALAIFETTNFFSAIVQDVTGGTIGNDPLHRAPDPVTGYALDSYPVDTPSDDPNPG